MLWVLSCFVFYGVVLIGFEAAPASLSSEKGICGMSPAVERYKVYNPNRIFGGDNSNEGDFPWYIWQYADGGGCSGTIVHERWILTAAHCFEFNQTIKSYTAHYGSVYWKNMKTINGSEYFIHPDYADGILDDIALVKLNESLEFSETVQPVCLDKSANPADDEILTVIGMGRQFKKMNATDIISFSSIILQDAPIQNLQKCDFEKTLCEGGVNHGTLSGDSGSSLMVIRDNRFVQVGVVHGGRWLEYQNETLSANTRKYFAKVSYYCDWIKATTKNEVQC